MLCSRDQNSPKGARVILGPLKQGTALRYHDPLIEGIYELQGLSRISMPVALALAGKIEPGAPHHVVMAPPAVSGKRDEIHCPSYNECSHGTPHYFLPEGSVPANATRGPELALLLFRATRDGG